MKRIKVFGLGVVCAMLLASAAVAEAQSPYVGGGYGPWYGYSGYEGGLFGDYQSQSLPYFALFPPVYYSCPVPRTYGYSPFAYPSYVMTPEAPPAAPVTVTNPYVPKAPAKPAEKETPPAPKVKQASTAESPLRIQNPYVQKAGVSAPAAAITGSDPAPQVIFPTLASRKP